METCQSMTQNLNRLVILIVPLSNLELIIRQIFFKSMKFTGKRSLIRKEDSWGRSYRTETEKHHI